jgi:hypothetical protein
MGKIEIKKKKKKRQKKVLSSVSNRRPQATQVQVLRLRHGIICNQNLVLFVFIHFFSFAHHVIWQPAATSPGLPHGRSPGRPPARPGQQVALRPLAAPVNLAKKRCGRRVLTSDLVDGKFAPYKCVRPRATGLDT